MRKLTFKNGIHPEESKVSTSALPLETILPKAGLEMVYPLVQNTGAPCKPIVQIGDEVCLGQKIADSEAFVSSPVHSSVSGIVKGMRKALTPTGVIADAIVIENDGKNIKWDTLKSYNDYTLLSKEEIIKKIREAGVVGLGGAGFPTHVKLSPPPDKKIDTVIINASECEPYLTSDHRALLDETERVLEGIRVVLRIFPDAKALIAIEDNKPDAIEKLTHATKNENSMEVKSLVTKYPQGSEKQLIYSCLKREVPSGGLPADIGALVVNVDTLIAIERAVLRDRPLIRKIVTLDGGAVKNPGNYRVRIGMSYRDFLEAVGGLKSEPAKMISGGPMMGVSMFSLDVPVIKVSSAFLCLTADEVKTYTERNCIRCGKCVSHCPMGLLPYTLNQNVVHGEMDEFLKNNGMDCVECGSCSYVCPSKRHIAQSIRSTRRHRLEQMRRGK
ncbi:MAG: electron transport complex subunit RsxC [Clostridiales bacterium]|jgi:electron transport complex protein RnfC|nr:electron transport complex subunit RsxC [Clostridiales bacterium]